MKKGAAIPCVFMKGSSCLNHFYLTTTFTFLRIFPDFTVIQAVPFFFPVITPLELTVTIFLFEELQVTFSWEVIGLMTGFSVSFLFLATVTLDFSPVIFVVLTVIFLHSNRNDLFLAAGQCNGHFDYYLNSSPQPFH